MSLKEKTVRTVEAAKAAIDLKIKSKEHGEFGYKLFLIEKMVLAFQTLRPKELRKWMNFASSYRHGAYILDQVFPKYENPEPFHSTVTMVDLSDNPVQVLGWNDVEELTKQGIEQGLNRNWIDLGFNIRAEERGIDLEGSFFATPPTRDDHTLDSGIEDSK